MADPDHLFDEAVGYHQSGDLENARAGYSRLLSMQPNNSAVLHVLGIVCFQQNDLLDAEENLRAAIALTADDPTYHKNLGSVLKAQERWQEAVDAFEAAIGLKPDFHDALNDLGSTYFGMGRLQDAEDIFCRLIENDPGCANALHNLGVLRFRQGNMEEAKRLLQKALELRPDYLDAHANIGRLFFECNEFDLAAEHLNIARRHRPDDSQVLKLLAHSLRLRDPATALNFARRAIDCVPNDATNHVALGSVLQSLGRFEEAEVAYQKALTLDPHDSDALNNLGTIFKERDENLRALRCFQGAIKQREMFSDAYYNLGTVLQDLGDIDQAIESFKCSLRIRPKQNPAYRCLTDIYQATGRAAQAIDILKRWLEDDPNNATAQHRLAAAQQSDAPARASDDYVREEFDRFASGFDKTLAKLHYCAPEKIVDCLRANVFERFSSVLDAGCGTGLAAVLLKPLCASLSGVDLSPRMIEHARNREAYDELRVGELVHFMNERPQQHDLIFSADTLVYFGDLGPFFAAANRSLRKRSYLAFSIEHLDESSNDSYVLNSSGRYCHKTSYIRSSLRDAGFDLIDFRREVIREELNRPVAGLVVLARQQKVVTSSPNR